MLTINCDLGEGFGIYRTANDKEIMPYIDMANLACGFHASDPLHMMESVALAKLHGVTIGAHPGYPDLQGFGRRVMHCSAQEIEAMLLYQIGALDAICYRYDTEVRYVKPHGALYNQMMEDLALFETVVRTLSCYRTSLSLMILSTPDASRYEQIAECYGINLLFELFVDRAYTDAGRLVPRTYEGAVLTSEEAMLDRVVKLRQEGVLESINKRAIHLRADTLCIHSDTPGAAQFAGRLRSLLAED